MLGDEDSTSTEIALLKNRVQELEEAARRSTKELEVLREMVSALNERAGLASDLRPPLAYTDQQGEPVPVVELAALTPGEIARSDRIGSGAPVILRTPEKRRLQVQAFVEARARETLYVVLHGAHQVGEQTPRFERIRSMRESGHSFCAIGDPTIDLADELTLAWYVGHNAIDLRDVITPLVEGLVGALAPPQVVFVGSSGGGFAAMQNSARVPGSLAFVMDPQVLVPNYYSGHISRFLKHAFDGFSVEAVMEEFGERLSVVEAYRRLQPDNYVYYCQHREDIFHAEGHLGPFAELKTVPLEGGESPDGRVLLEWIREGRHGPLRAPGQFEATLARAVAWHRAKIDPHSTDGSRPGGQDSSAEGTD